MQGHSDAKCGVNYIVLYAVRQVISLLAKAKAETQIALLDILNAILGCFVISYRFTTFMIDLESGIICGKKPQIQGSVEKIRFFPKDSLLISKILQM